MSTRSETQLKFQSHWTPIVSRKLNAAPKAALVQGLTTMLSGFARFRDVVDVDLRLLEGSLTAQDLRRLLDSFLCFVDEFQRGADYIFEKPPRERAMQVYQRPLDILRWILLGLLDGHAGAWSVLAEREEGVSSDIGIVREFKDQIARTYRFLVRFVKSDVAESAIRKVIDSYTGTPSASQQEPNCAAASAQVSSAETATPVPTPQKWTRLAPFQFSEFKHIRKRYPTAGQIGRGYERHALELLKSCGISSPVQKQKHQVDHAKQLIAATKVATYLLCRHLPILAWNSIIPSTRATHKGSPKVEAPNARRGQNRRKAGEFKRRHSK